MSYTDHKKYSQKAVICAIIFRIQIFTCMPDTCGTLCEWLQSNENKLLFADGTYFLTMVDGND